jgi:tripartite-type tricarboxylate transporter receptor subunit TctC
MKLHTHWGWIGPAAVLIGATVFPAPAVAQQFPTKDINWIVPAAPGGGYDTWARAFARSIEKDLPSNVKIIVKNVPGAGTRTGTIQLYRSKPDGYTIGMLDISGLVPYQIAVGAEKAGFDVNRFSYISMYGEAPRVIGVKKDSPIKSLKDVKAQGDKLRWGVLGPGETHWLNSLIFSGELGIPFNQVAGYKGVSDLVPALLRGDFHLVAWHSTTIVQYVRSGDIRVIAVAADERFPVYPDVPTAKEQGYDMRPVNSVRVASAPPGTPPEVVKVLEGMLLKALKDPELLKWAESQGFTAEIKPGGGAAAAEAVQRIVKVSEKYRKEIEAGLKVGN